MSSLERDAHEVGLWHFRTFLLLLTLATPPLITPVEAKETFYKGKLVDIGTHRLHINCAGEGSPTVIFDSGIGGFSLEWSKIQKNLIKNNLKVCSYDRAGYGWSDSGPQPRTTARITKELKTLLIQANITGPYLLVGHSFGGFNIRYFASEYPQLIAGLILIDSSHPQQFNTDEFKTPKLIKMKPIKNASSFHFNIIRPIISNNFPNENKRVARILMSTKKSLRTLVNELENMEISAIQLAERSNHTPYEFPVMIITRGMRVWPNDRLGNRKEQQWTKLQYDLENISNNSAHFFARRSGHTIHLDEPKFVTDKILSTIEKYRNNIIKNELRKMLAVNLTTYPIKFSMNSLLISKQNSITGLSRRSEIEKYLSINEWSDNSSLAQQFDVKKVIISNDFLYLK